MPENILWQQSPLVLWVPGHGAERLLSLHCPWWAHIYQYVSSKGLILHDLTVSIMILFVTVANSLMRNSLRSRAEVLLRVSSHVCCSLISRMDLEKWNYLKQTAERWLLSVHPELMPACPTTLGSFLEKVLQALRRESCMFQWNRSTTHWGCVHFLRNTWQSHLRSLEWTEMLQPLLWWADSAYCHCPAFLGWADKLYKPLGLHSSQSSQAGSRAKATLCQGVRGHWRKAHLLSTWPPSVQG